MNDIICCKCCKPTYPRSFQKTFDPIFYFLQERGWIFNPGGCVEEESNFIGWIDYKTNNRYFDAKVPIFIESLRLDSELNLCNKQYIKDKNKNEMLLSLFVNLNKED
jgi:hypothetical protein